MLPCTRNLPHLHRPTFPLKSLFSLPTPPLPVTSPSFLSLPRCIPPLFSFSATTAPAAASPTTAMASTTTTTVEHIVLFKVKSEADPTKIDAMITNLRSLISLDGVCHLAAGAVLRHRSAAAAVGGGFTHLLHSRYRTKVDLSAYSAHPVHLAVVKDFVLPICDDIMAVDWVADDVAPSPLRPGSGMRVTLAKVKEGSGEAEKGEVMVEIAGIRGVCSEVEQVSFGENFSPARAKGYSIGVIAVFPGVEEIDGLDEKRDLVEAQKEKVRPLLDSVIVVDFLIPPPPAASL